MKLVPWKKSYDNLERIKKQKSVQSKLWFYQWSCMDHKEGWCFWNVVLEKILESPLDGKEIKLVNLWKVNTQYSLEGLVLKLQHSGHLMQRADSLEKTLMLGKIDGRRRRGQGLDGWMAIPIPWTQVWANSRKKWSTGKPGMLQSMGAKWVGHHLVTEHLW